MGIARATRTDAWSLQTFSDYVFAASAVNEVEGLIIGVTVSVYFECKGWDSFLGNPLINASFKLWPVFTDIFRDGFFHELLDKNSHKRFDIDFQCLFLLALSNMWFFSSYWRISHDATTTRDLSLAPLILLLASLLTIYLSIFCYGLAKTIRILLVTFGMFLSVVLFFYLQILFSAPVLKVVEFMRILSAATSSKALYFGDIVLAIVDVVLIIPVFWAYVVIARDLSVLGREALDGLPQRTQR